MVQTKVIPCHAEIHLLKYVVYITQNPVTFVIQRHHELFLLDQLAQEKKHLKAYKWHVHKLPMTPSSAAMPKDTTHSRCDKITTLHRRR